MHATVSQPVMTIGNSTTGAVSRSHHCRWRTIAAETHTIQIRAAAKNTDASGLNIMRCQPCSAIASHAAKAAAMAHAESAGQTEGRAWLALDIS